MIIAIGALVMCVMAGGVFWRWLQATHGEIGPALVATTLSIVVIVGAMVLALKLQEPREDSWLRDGLPVYASERQNRSSMIS
jgi:O-antigen/teichoic acid export membrane protein